MLAAVKAGRGMFERPNSRLASVVRGGFAQREPAGRAVLGRPIQPVDELSISCRSAVWDGEAAMRSRNL